MSRVVRAFLEGPYASMKRRSTNLSLTDRIWWTPVDSCNHTPQTTAVQLSQLYRILSSNNIYQIHWQNEMDAVDAFETHRVSICSFNTYNLDACKSSKEWTELSKYKSHSRIFGITIWCYLSLNPWGPVGTLIQGSVPLANKCRFSSRWPQGSISMSGGATDFSKNQSSSSSWDSFLAFGGHVYRLSNRQAVCALLPNKAVHQIEGTLRTTKKSMVTNSSCSPFLRALFQRPFCVVATTPCFPPNQPAGHPHSAPCSCWHSCRICKYIRIKEIW